MATNTKITIIGNLGDDPSLRFTQSGLPVANLSVAVTPRVRDANGDYTDGEPSWYRCTVWREMAENVAESLRKGDRVIVHGDLVQRTYQDNDGNDRVSVEVNVEELGHTLRFGTTQYTATTKQERPQQNNNRGRQRSTSRR